MARETDPEIRENIDRAPKDENAEERKDENVSDNKTKPSDSIKNANAAGLGAIGRNDEEQTNSKRD